MIAPDERLLRATRCLHYWLCYLKNASSNDKLFAESSLKFPFVESLERHNINEIELEYNHPNYEKKREDVKIAYPQDNQGNQECCYIEFKFVREDTTAKQEQQRYFNDIMRLWTIHTNEQNSSCYFIVCGPTEVFNGCLKGEQLSLNGKDKIVESQLNKKRNIKKTAYKEWLSFNRKQRVKRITPQKDFVDGFNKEYNVDYAYQDIKIMTRLVLLLPDRMDNDQSYSVGLWHVYSQ